MAPAKESHVKRRARILKAISGEKPDRVPIGFDVYEPLRSQLVDHYGASSFRDLYAKSGIDCFSVWDWPAVLPDYRGPKRAGVENLDATYGCWGKVGERRYPLADCTLDEYRWPRADDFDYSGLRTRLDEVRDHDMTAASGHAGLGWLHHVQMRGYDLALLDVLDDAWMEEYVARNREFALAYFRALFAEAGGFIDVIRADEDLGGQTGMLISPDLWRRWYKPLWKEVLALCHGHGARVWLHSCGYCRSVIPDFVEIGVDVLNPIPPYVRDGDPASLKQEFGNRLAFDGGVDHIHALVGGTPELVRTETKLRLTQLAPGGGYLLGPSQVLTRDVPFENAVAMFETALEFGGY